MELSEPRTGMMRIDRDDCLRLLANRAHGVGRLAVVEGSRPLILPVNYAMVEDRIVFKTGIGTKLEVAERSGAVAFEIDEFDQRTASGWSVVVRGRSEVVTNKQQLFLLRATPLAPFVEDRDRWIMIHPDTITGRRVPPHGHFVL